MRRSLAVAALGVRRTLGRLRTADSRRLLLSVVGVALAVGLMTTVTGVSLGLAAGSTVRGSGVDYWVVPQGSTASTVAVSVDGPQLGSVHAVSDRLAGDDRIDYVTPVQLRLLRLTAGNESAYVLAVGVVPPDDDRSVVGVPIGVLTPGDPHYADGNYDGPWTGEAVLSQAAAKLLNASAGDRLVVGSHNRTVSATAVERGDVSSGLGPVPVAVMHLSELQSLTGSTAGDQADQLLVSTDDPSVRDRLESVYPRTDVVARGGLSSPSVSTSSLPLAVALTALVASLIVGVLFVATLAGLDVTADRRTLAALGALGFSARSRAVLVASQTVAVALVGGLLGVVLGGVGIVAVNAGADAVLGVGPVAQFHPALLAYGVIVGLLIGLLAAPYPVLLGRRTDLLEVLKG